MKLALVFLAICLASCLAAAIDDKKGEPKPESKSEPKGDLNRPKLGVFGKKDKRSPDEEVKGHVRVHPLFNLAVRKGEYVCGNKICKLEPGVVPRGCHGVCQYPILPGPGPVLL